MKTGLLITTGIAVAASAVVSARQVAFAQSGPMLSQAAVEQELATVATQMAANPNGYTNATLTVADARGLTLSLHFRLKRNRNLSVEQYGAQVTTSFCQNTAMRQYTDQYGVVLDINVAASNGSGARRFQINHDVCVRATGISLAPPVAQNRFADSASPALPTSAQRCAAYVARPSILKPSTTPLQLSPG